MRTTTLQWKLISPPQPATIPARPCIHDAEVIAEAVKAIAPRFRAYCIEGNGSPEAVEEDLVSLMDDYDLDGYHLARRLEREFHWAEDRELVNLCDQAASVLRDTHNKIVQEWIVAFNMQPRFKAEARVYVEVPRTYKLVRERLEGTVVTVDHFRGCYTICVPDLGHVRTGLGTYGVVLTWEEVEAANG